MHEITDANPEKINGVSILIGTAKCDARCKECAGRQHRHNAPLRDGELDVWRLKEILTYCYKSDCRHVTLTGSGEPTLSPQSITRALAVVHEYAENGKIFNPVNVYTNGIRIGTDAAFCEAYLSYWKQLGLTSVYVSVYSDNEVLNASAFGVDTYPPFEIIFKRIKQQGLKLRTSVILKSGYIDTLEKFQRLCEKFLRIGVDNVTAWPLKDEEGFISNLAPDHLALETIAKYGKTKPDHIRILLDDANSKNALGKKIALFQNGEISDVWCARK